jgi:uncharacterized protein (TIGR03083 family)
MKLVPRYDGPALLRFEDHVADPAVPLLRQRRRLGGLLGELDDAQWCTPSRCDGWTVRDVVAHLVGTDGFWTLATTAALAGEPSRYLTGFDPVATPASMVEATKAQPSAEVLASYLAGVDGLAAIITGLDANQWDLPAEAPPGHVALHAMARHALWDAWIHERDILLPLGLPMVEEPDEVRACLEHAAGLGPAFSAMCDSTRTGTLVVDGSDPDVRVVVEVADPVVVHNGAAPDDAVHLTGPSVALVEAFSFRAPFPTELAADDRWLLGDLATVFDQVEPS